MFKAVCCCGVCQQNGPRVFCYTVLRMTVLLFMAFFMSIIITRICFNSTIFVSRNGISAIFKSLHQGQITNALYFLPTIIFTSTVLHDQATIALISVRIHIDKKK